MITCCTVSRIHCAADNDWGADGAPGGPLVEVDPTLLSPGQAVAFQISRFWLTLGEE